MQQEVYLYLLPGLAGHRKALNTKASDRMTHVDILA